MAYKKNIAVIGCGVSGIATLRVLSENIPEYNFDVNLTAYDKSEKFGGVWNYNENISDEKFLSPIYRDLYSNLPKEVMYYPDMKYSDDIKESFIHHTVVLDYIKKYVAHFDLQKYMQLNTAVSWVEPIGDQDEEDGEPVRWSVTVENSQTTLKETREFDAVVVCNGHFEEPRMPTIAGMEHFRGEVLHSKFYRFPEKYAGRIVLVLGAKSSGLDIALQLCNTAEKVYLAHNRNRLTWKTKPVNLVETFGIKTVLMDGSIKLEEDDGTICVDCMVLCTGYHISCPFLSEKCRLQWDGEWVRPLYLSLVNPHFPCSFFMVGLGFEIAPFLFFYIQAKLVRAFIQNCVRLDDHKVATPITSLKALMFKSIELEMESIHKSHVLHRYIHYQGSRQWEYMVRVSKEANALMTAPFPFFSAEMCGLSVQWRYRDTQNYRRVAFKLDPLSELGFVIKECDPAPPDSSYLLDYNYLVASIRGEVPPFTSPPP